MKVTNLSSGSKGNCTFVETDSTKILVDIGINYKSLQESLAVVSFTANILDAVLITHEHSDHVSGLELLIKKQPHLHVYVHKLVWEYITKKYSSLQSFDNVHFINYNLPFSVGDFTVLPMENFHDSVSCASFIINAGGGKLGICTDLGIITEYQVSMLSECKVVYLECNHDKQMLKDCHYPQIIKNRIAGNYGHLSNNQCAESAVVLASNKTKVLVLSHISENSNLPEIAYTCVANKLAEYNLDDIHLLIGYQKKVGKTITIL